MVLKFVEGLIKHENSVKVLGSYVKEIKPIIKKIKRSKNENAEQAKYLLEDNEYYWFKSKTER